MSGIVDDLKANVDDILKLRDDLGVALKEVYIVTRTWAGAEPGDGEVIEEKVRMLPSPRVVEFKNDLRILEGGAVKQGDILLKMVSKQSYPIETDVDCSSTNENIEKFYELNGRMYRVIAVTEKHVVWSVLLRPLTDQKRPDDDGNLLGPPQSTSDGADPI